MMRLLGAVVHCRRQIMITIRIPGHVDTSDTGATDGRCRIPMRTCRAWAVEIMALAVHVLSGVCEATQARQHDGRLGLERREFGGKTRQSWVLQDGRLAIGARPAWRSGRARRLPWPASQRTAE